VGVCVRAIPCNLGRLLLLVGRSCLPRQDHTSQDHFCSVIDEFPVWNSEPSLSTMMRSAPVHEREKVAAVGTAPAALMIAGYPHGGPVRVGRRLSAKLRPWRPCTRRLCRPLSVNFAQWRYSNQWSNREVLLLLVENYTQYPALTRWNTLVWGNFCWALRGPLINSKMMPCSLAIHRNRCWASASLLGLLAKIKV